MHARLTQRFISLTVALTTAALTSSALIAAAPRGTSARAVSGPPAPPPDGSVSYSTLGPWTSIQSTPTTVPDGSASTSNIVVSGFPASPPLAIPYLWDVDVTVTLSHSVRAEDLDVSLIAPNGRVVTLSTDNGGAVPIASQTLIYDDSADTPVRLAAGAGAVWVIPEGALSSLIGQSINPNGTWRLRVGDDVLDGTGGTIESWSLDITTLDARPTLYGPTTFAASPNRPIPDNGVLKLTDGVVGGGMGSFLAEVRVFAKIAHPKNGQLEIELLGPGGIVPLSLHNGGDNANVFGNTTWRDGHSSPPNDKPTTDAVYVSGVAQLQLVPEGALGYLIGSDPNWGWTLSIRDTVPGDAGVLEQWSVTIWTYDQAPSGGSQCISGTSANGCTPTIGTTQANGALELVATNVDGLRTALFFYGLTGIKNPVGTWGLWSTLCVKSPVQRTNPVSTGGTPGVCDGAVLIGWQAFLASHPYALGVPVADGTTITAQLWWRDPASVKTTQLSNVMQFVSTSP